LFRTGADPDHECHCNGDAKFGGNCHSDTDADCNGDADLYGNGDGDGRNANPDCDGNCNWGNSACGGNIDAGCERGLSDGCESERE
jgi:hypothetical protein